MNYSQTLEFLFSSMPTFQEKGVTAYKPGLERIAAFCRHLGNPQRNYFTIHVAGTNGKGSVSHIIAAVLQQAGYRTGLFTSPHLHDFRERIRVDGEMIPKQKVVNFVDKHRDKMTELGLSFFEMTAALAFDYFAQSDVEVAVIETGLGGRLEQADLLIVGGTSLSVYPAAGLLRYYRGGRLVLINRDPTPFDEEAGLLIQEPIGRVLGALCVPSGG